VRGDHRHTGEPRLELQGFTPQHLLDEQRHLGAFVLSGGHCGLQHGLHDAADGIGGGVRLERSDGLPYRLQSRGRSELRIGGTSRDDTADIDGGPLRSSASSLRCRAVRLRGAGEIERLAKSQRVGDVTRRLATTRGILEKSECDEERKHGSDDGNPIADPAICGSQKP
jgi:hypothetical protein